MNNKSIRSKLITLCLFLGVALCLTGCWDKVEINERAFVLGLGVDVDEEKKNFLMSLAIPNLPVLTGQASGGETAFVKQVSDQSLLGAFKKMNTRVNKQINVENLEVVVFGADLLKNSKKVKEVFDHFERNPSYSRNLPVVVARSSAKTILDIKPEGAQVVGGYIGGIYKNNSQYVTFFNKMFLGSMLRDALEYDGTFIVPEVKGHDNEVMLGGGAVVKDFEFKGWLNESEVRSIAWIREGMKDTQVNFEFMGTIIPFVFTGSQKKVYFDLKDNRLLITIDIKTEGEVTEFIFNEDGMLTDESYIDLMQDTLALEMENEVKGVIHRMQTEFKADLFRLNESLKIKDKDLYLQTKDHWSEFFSASHVNVNIDVKVRRFGEVK